VNCGGFGIGDYGQPGKAGENLSPSIVGILSGILIYVNVLKRK
jgi:hypothetical protein